LLQCACVKRLEPSGSAGIKGARGISRDQEYNKKIVRKSSKQFRTLKFNNKNKNVFFFFK